MDGLETRLPNHPEAEETLKRKYKTRVLSDYLYRTEKRGRQREIATRLENAELGRRQKRDRRTTENLITKNILGAWAAAINTLKRTELGLAAARGQAASFDPKGVQTEMSNVRPQLQRLADPAEIARLYESVIAAGDRTRTKAVCELAATRLFEIQNATNPSLRRGIALIEGAEIRQEAGKLRTRIENTLSELENTLEVRALEIDNNKAQAKVRLILDMVDEAERLFGWNTFFGGGPFTSIGTEINIVGTVSEGVTIEMSGEAQTRYAVGYTPVERTE